MSDDPMFQNLELYFNEQAADMEVMRLIIQTMLVNMAVAQPRMVQLIEDMKRRVLFAVANPVPAPGIDPQGATRRRELTKMRAESFFQEIETALRSGGTIPGTSGAH